MEQVLEPSSNAAKQNFSALDELTGAMDNHAIWLKNMIRSLICNDAIDINDTAADAHRMCLFGRWCDQQGRQLFEGDNVFSLIEERHQAMHDAARIVLRKRASGEAVTAAEYDHFMDLALDFQAEARQLQYTLLQRVCTIDQLTGTGNRYAMCQRLFEEKERAGRNAQHCAIAIMDLDHFKQINDLHGPLAGDNVLKQVAVFISNAIRKYDAVFRYGGEEFLICLPNSDLKTAEKRMNHLREDLAALKIEIAPETAIKMTASFGLGYLRPGYPIQDSIQHADSALLRAKDAGRNRVEVSDWS